MGFNPDRAARIDNARKQQRQHKRQERRIITGYDKNESYEKFSRKDYRKNKDSDY